MSDRIEYLGTVSAGQKQPHEKAEAKEGPRAAASASRRDCAVLIVWA